MTNESTPSPLNHSRWDGGRATEALLVEVYDELRAIAAAHLRRERPGHTLQPTALVHEAFLRLVRYQKVDLNDRSYFLALGAQCIRRILLEHARSRKAQKRGGGADQVTLVDGLVLGRSDTGLDLIELDDLLKQLERRNLRQARVVELRFFGGQSIEEAAATLQVSAGTVKSDWRFARAWLRSRMSPGECA